MLKQCLEEVVAVAHARKIAMSATAIADTMKFYDGLPPGGTTSLQRDIVDGKPSELEYWNGAVVRLGREAQVPTPTHEYIYNCLLPQDLRARGKIAFSEVICQFARGSESLVWVKRYRFGAPRAAQCPHRSEKDRPKCREVPGTDIRPRHRGIGPAAQDRC